MNTSGNTILITGGSAGIGFEMAKHLTQNGNHVIIIGRNDERLKKAAAQLKNITAIQCDVTKQADVQQLVETLMKEHPNMNILINNAGKAFAYYLSSESNAFEKAAEEMMTNYLSVIDLTERLLPLLGRQKEAAIVNVSSIVAFAPSAFLPTY